MLTMMMVYGSVQIVKLYLRILDDTRIQSIHFSQISYLLV